MVMTNTNNGNGQIQEWTKANNDKELMAEVDKYRNGQIQKIANIPAMVMDKH